MASIPFAFSVHHFVSSVGADAGFAAIVGLAILVFLYFAQARETASLRERAEESAEHVQQLEARVEQLSRNAAVRGSITSPPAPAPAPPGMAPQAPRPASAPAVAAHSGTAAPVAARAASPAIGAGAAPQSVPVAVAAPSAPAGVGAPAMDSATRLIPASGRDELTTYSNGAAGGPPVLAQSGPRPATAAGGANGGSAGRSAGPAASATMPPPVSAPATGVRPAGARPPAPRPAVPPRRPGGPGSPRGGDSGGGGPRSRRAFIILGTLLAVAAAVVVVVIATSGSGTSTNASSTAGQTISPSSQTRAGRAGPIKPASVTVAVLNGTSTSNLAHNVAQQLTASRYKVPTIATATDQTHTATLVGYMPGHRTAALLVARSLKLGSASVQPVDQSSRAVACPAPTPCTAKVVVTVGSDLVSTP